MPNNSKKIIFTVINDLVYDRRMARICSTLARDGYAVELVGRVFKNSPALLKKPYSQHRIKCWFKKSALFYLEYNIRLFFYLLFSDAHIYGAIDLDTILPHKIVSVVKRKPMVYDAHEYFTEVIEIQDKKLVKWVWKTIERLCVSKKTWGYTVSSSYAKLFKDEYGCHFELIKNAPPLKSYLEENKPEKFTFVYIGAVNEGRGIEECIKAVEGLDCLFKICGDGDLLVDLQDNLPVEQMNQVSFTGYLTPDELEKEARKSHCGVLLFKAESLSYYYSLANKFFDYIHAEIPQIVVDFPEYEILNKSHNIGLLSAFTVDDIRQNMRKIMENQSLYLTLKNNTAQAKKELNWEKEGEKLIRFYSQF